MMMKKTVTKSKILFGKKFYNNKYFYKYITFILFKIFINIFVNTLLTVYSVSNYFTIHTLLLLLIIEALNQFWRLRATVFQLT